MRPSGDASLFTIPICMQSDPAGDWQWCHLNVLFQGSKPGSLSHNDKSENEDYVLMLKRKAHKWTV